MDDHDHTRVELEWLASDEEGFVALFSTAGAGPVPASALEQAAFLEDVLERIARLPTSAPLEGASVTYPREWYDVALRGLYVYDWNSSTKRYERCAAPVAPKKLGDIEDAELARSAHRVPMPHRFALAGAIAPEPRQPK